MKILKTITFIFLLNLSLIWNAESGSFKSSFDGHFYDIPNTKISILITPYTVDLESDDNYSNTILLKLNSKLYYLSNYYRGSDGQLIEQSNSYSNLSYAISKNILYLSVPNGPTGHSNFQFLLKFSKNKLTFLDKMEMCNPEQNPAAANQYTLTELKDINSDGYQDIVCTDEANSNKKTLVSIVNGKFRPASHKEIKSNNFFKLSRLKSKE